MVGHTNHSFADSMEGNKLQIFGCLATNVIENAFGTDEGPLILHAHIVFYWAFAASTSVTSVVVLSGVLAAEP